MPQAAKHYQPALIERDSPSPAPAAKEGLSFAFSTSEDKATGSFFNRARLAGAMRLSSTLMNGVGDFIQENRCNTIANMLGLWGNATYLIFGNNKNPVLGQLAIVHGDWEQDGNFYTQRVPHILTQESIDRISHMIDDIAQPRNAMTAHIERDLGYTEIRIRADLFNQVQDAMKHSLERRTKAFAILAEPERHLYANDTLGQKRISGVMLAGIDDDIVREIYEITRNEWQIRTRIAGDDDQTRHLKAHPIQLAEFEERTQNINPQRHQHILVKRDSRADHAPGFFKTMFQPHKYPVEHSVLMGGLMGNVMRNAGVIERVSKTGKDDNRLKTVRPEEFVSNTMNIMSYLVELQPETSRHKRGDWEKTGDDRQFFTKESRSWKEDFLDLTDERPMLAGALIRPASLFIKVTGQARELGSLSEDLKISPGDDKIRENIRGQQFRLAATAMDFATLLVSGGLKKADFGR